ncbi:permease-like cell division protein FtsX [Bacillus spongiae]|uniref:Cell division protein FtsX n=1 Tax=Bacillus spongiae TaxID=2683610 RepID=A0ABU8HEM5_9BACI
MNFNTLLRHLRESLKNIVRNSWMTFASASAVTVTLVLVGVFVVLMLNMNKVATDIEKDIEIKVFLSLEADEEMIDKLESQIEGISGVESIVFSSKDEELKDLMDDVGEEFGLFEQENPLYDAFVIKAEDPTETKSIATQIRRFDNIEEVVYGEAKIDRLFSFFKYSRNVGLVLIIGLLFTAMFLISNTIKITIVARRKEIEIMKLVGATNWFVRWPFILEGLWLGILGSVIPVILVSTSYYYAYQYIEPKLRNSLFSILEVTPFIYQVNILIVLMGCLIGVWGSMMSVRKFLKI